MMIPTTLLSITLGFLVWSGWQPHDRFTWFLEVCPVIIGYAILIPTYNKFRLTTLLYVCITIHAIVLMIGGRYTYARVPFGFTLQDILDLSRNPYDRIGHLAQGFFPAILARELLLRLTPLKKGGWLVFLVIAVCLGFSAFYELLEWGVAMLTGESAEDFLGTQGDVWDTQWDMFLALCGACLGLALLSKWHDAQLRKLS